MPIKFRCVHCGQFLGISRSKAGTVVDCPTCGRSVGVPEKDGQADRVGNPELNHEDSQLANALREVAAIAAQSSSMALPQVPSQSSSAEVPNGDGRETREVNALPPQVVSTLPQPPVQPIPPKPQPNPHHQPPVQDPLASLAAPPPDTQASETPKPPSSSQDSQFQWTNEIPWKLWLAFVGVGFVAIIAGFTLGRWNVKTRTAAAPETQPESQPQTPAVPKPMAVQPEVLTKLGSVAFTGTIKYTTGEGGVVQADPSAWIYAFPAERTSDEKIPQAWLASKKETENETASAQLFVQAALQVMGGNAAPTDAKGNFQLRLANKGRYHLLVCTTQIARKSDHPIDPKVLTLLGNYFQDPKAFLGQRPFEILKIQDYQTDTPVAIADVTLEP